MLKIKLSFTDRDFRTYQRFMGAIAPWLAEARVTPPALDLKTGLYRAYIEAKTPPRNGENT